MKRILLLLLLPMLLGGCEKDESRVETWTVAPEKGVAGITMGFGHIPAYIVKRGTEADWEIFPSVIEGFTFEKGYESILRVRIDVISNPPADGPSHRYTMEEMLRHVPAEMPVDPLKFSPEYEVLVASEQTAVTNMNAYWIKDLRANDPQWAAFPWEIRGFDFTPGYEYRLRIQPVAEYNRLLDNLIDQDSWTVRYDLKVLISCEEKDSVGQPEEV